VRRTLRSRHLIECPFGGACWRLSRSQDPNISPKNERKTILFTSFAWGVLRNGYNWRGRISRKHVLYFLAPGSVPPCLLIILIVNNSLCLLVYLLSVFLLILTYVILFMFTVFLGTLKNVIFRTAIILKKFINQIS